MVAFFEFLAYKLLIKDIFVGVFFLNFKIFVVVLRSFYTVGFTN